jgi:hypothetical protein
MIPSSLPFASTWTFRMKGSEDGMRTVMDAIQPDIPITEDRIKTWQTALIKEYLSAPVYVVKVFRSRRIQGHQPPPLGRPLDPILVGMC